MRPERISLPRPRTPLAVRVVGLLLAVAVAAGIIKLVFTFAWYASGLAADKAEERARREAPIPVDFSKP